MFFSLYLFPCLIATLLKKNYQRILMKFSKKVRNDTRINWLDFGSDPGLLININTEQYHIGK